MKKRHISALLLALILLIGTVQPAFAAPTPMQINFISRMSGPALCVELNGSMFYVNGKDICRMGTDGKNQKVLFTMTAPRDLQIYGGRIYFIDEDAENKTYTLYRFSNGDTKATKLLDNVYDGAIGGEVLYYTNPEGTTVSSWNLRTDKKRTMYNNLFSGTRDINYMQTLLTFTAEIKNKSGVEETCVFIYSPKTDNATYYKGSAKGMLAQGNYIYMPEDGNYTKLSFDASKPSIARGSMVLEGTTAAVMSGNYFYLWRNDTAKNMGRIYKREISGTKETLYHEYSLEDTAIVYLEPTIAANWLFAYSEEKGNYFVERLPK